VLVLLLVVVSGVAVALW
jgi:hypothetical protein